MAQLPLTIPQPACYLESAFMVGPCNAQAFYYVDTWPVWDKPKHVCVWGDARSGKTHLAHVLAAKAQVPVLSGPEATHTHPFEVIGTQPLVIVDDADGITDSEWLFHFYNHAVQQGVGIFYTAHTPPTQWNHTLPDLRSRLSTLISQPIYNPDDAILAKLLHKQFGERGLRVSPDLTRYILTHVERSYEGLLDFIEQVDYQAATLKKPLSRPLVKAVLEG